MAECGCEHDGNNMVSACALHMGWMRMKLRQQEEHPITPLPMLLWCPECSTSHVDGGEFATKAHHTHACQNCGHVWRPAIVATVGVQFLPGFKDAW